MGSLSLFTGFPGSSAGKESACNAGDLGLDPWVRTIPWLPTPVFWPGEFHGLYSPWGCKESDTTERLSLSLFPSSGEKSRKLDSRIAGIFFTI